MAQGRAKRPSAQSKADLTPQLVFDVLRDIKDPEHPYTLEQLNVVNLELIHVSPSCLLAVQFRPTVPHCTLATLIGLCIRVKLMRAFPFPFKLDVTVCPGSHSTEESINRQINDKERIQAALENDYLRQVVEECVKTTDSSA